MGRRRCRDDGTVERGSTATHPQPTRPSWRSRTPTTSKSSPPPAPRVRGSSLVNAWLNNPPGVGLGADDSQPNGAGGGYRRRGDRGRRDGRRAPPGTYPERRPLPRVAPIWNAVAPSLDFLAPDVYFGDTDTIFVSSGRSPRGSSSPRDAPIALLLGVAQMFLVIGQYGASSGCHRSVWTRWERATPDEGPLEGRLFAAVARCRTVQRGRHPHARLPAVGRRRVSGVPTRRRHRDHRLPRPLRGSSHRRFPCTDCSSCTRICN